MTLLKALHAGGVGVLLGSDAPQQFNVPGFSIHREMKRMADAGMSAFEIVKSGTANVGAVFQGAGPIRHDRGGPARRSDPGRRQSAPGRRQHGEAIRRDDPRPLAAGGGDRRAAREDRPASASASASRRPRAEAHHDAERSLPARPSRHPHAGRISPSPSAPARQVPVRLRLRRRPASSRPRRRPPPRLDRRRRGGRSSTR